MSRKKLIGRGLILLFLFLVSGMGAGHAFEFTDPTNLFSTMIWDEWVYQAHHSNPHITVFYGEGDHDLLYFEVLGSTSDASARILAERTIQLYEEPGGLKDFHLEMPLASINVAGQWGLSCVYSYLDERGNKLWEYRIFMLLPDSQGLSIALASDGPWVGDDLVLEDILDNWRWLF